MNKDQDFLVNYKIQINSWRPSQSPVMIAGATIGHFAHECPANYEEWCSGSGGGDGSSGSVSYRCDCVCRSLCL